MIIATIFAALILAVAAFQVLLAAGAPLADYSWGGKYHGSLPPKVRVASGVSAVVCVAMCAVILDCAGVIDWLPGQLSRILAWVVFGFLTANTLGNLFSKSVKERAVMAPVSFVLAVLVLLLLI